MIIGYTISATETRDPASDWVEPYPISKLLPLSQPCIRALSHIKGMISFSWVISLQGEMTNPSSVPPYGGGW